MNYFGNFIKQYLLLIGTIIFSVCFFVNASPLPTISGAYPKILAILVALISLWIMISNIRSSKQLSVENKFTFKEYRRPILVFLVLLVYVVILSVIGFYVSSFLFLFVEMVLIEKDVNNRISNVLNGFLVCIPVISVAYLTFEILLKIYMPRGLLF